MRVTRMTAHQRPDSSDVVRIEAELSPLPPEEEQWWWLEQVHRQIGWAGVGLSTSSSRFAIHASSPRTELEAAARQLRDALAAAIALYPQRYAIDQEAMDEIRAERAEAERRQHDADQAVLDRVMNE